MNPIEALAAACELAGQQVDLAADKPDVATPCVDYTAAQLVGHMVAALDGNSAFFGGETEGLDPFQPPTYPAEEFSSRFVAAKGRLLAAVSKPGALDSLVEHPASPDPIPGAAAIMFPTFDMYVHAWDLAQANGVDFDGEGELFQLVDGFCRQNIGPEARQPGIVEAPVDPPETATPMQSLAAFLGRSWPA